MVGLIGQDEWDNRQGELQTFSGKTLKLAHAAIVEGKGHSVVAREYGVSRQLVSSAAKRVKDRLMSANNDGMVRLNCLIPETELDALIEYIKRIGGKI